MPPPGRHIFSHAHARRAWAYLPESARAVAMQHALIDFLNHGVLPFHGRDHERERIVAFWRETTHSAQLRAMLLVGEAGIGKSRLVEESLADVLHYGGAVVQARLYPGAANAPAALLAHALWNSGAGRRLLQREPEPTPLSVATALRRMSRLRPTLLVIEDIHLLAGDAVAETASLLAMVAGETLSILCTARPVETTARGMLEPYIVEEHRLDGLDGRALKGICRTLFGDDVEHDIQGRVRQATLGNPLAIRSALRGAMTSEALGRDPGSGGWRSMIPMPAFDASLRRYVGLLTDGMAAHLTAGERHAATALSSLGEVFARETAMQTIDNAVEMIEALLFKGVIVTSNTARPPVSGTACASPLLSFAHTLLHQQLAEEESLDAGRIEGIIAAGLPLYSILPFSILSRRGADRALPVELHHTAITRSIDVALVLDGGRDWELGMIAWEAANALHHSTRDLFHADEARLMEVKLAVHRAGLLRRRNHTPEYAALVDDALHLTASPESIEIARQRLHLLRMHIWVKVRRNPQGFAMAWGPVDELLADFPTLMASEAYMMLLRDLVQLCISLGDLQAVADVEERLRAALASDGATSEMHRIALRQIYVHLLVIFRTQEELERRLALLPEIEAATGVANLSVMQAKARLMEELGRYGELLALIGQIIPRVQEIGMVINVLSWQMIRIVAEAAVDGDIERAILHGRQLCADAPAEAAPRLPGEFGLRLVTVALMLGDAVSARSIADEFLHGRFIWPLHELLLALDEGKTERALQIAASPGEEYAVVMAIAGLIRSDADTVKESSSTVTAFLHDPILHITDVMTVHAVLGLLQLYGTTVTDGSGRRSFDDGMQALLRSTLVWLEERSLRGMMKPLLDRYGSLLPSREAGTWLRRCEQHDEERIVQPAPSSRGIELTMLGTIRLNTADGTEVHLRTGRLRTLLGVLVADRMIARHLSLQEFRELVTGESDPEQARKGTNLAVHRLREAIGHDAIITPSGNGSHDEAPALNTRLVHVDLLDVDRHLKLARAGLRQGLPVRASSELLEALALLRGEVAFPGLYDDFFEAAREDLEAQLHETIIDTARLLLEEGDLVMAAEVLHRGSDALPGDEELTEMLRETLLRDGQHVEAGRVRL